MQAAAALARIPKVTAMSLPCCVGHEHGDSLLSLNVAIGVSIVVLSLVYLGSRLRKDSHGNLASRARGASVLKREDRCSERLNSPSLLLPRGLGSGQQTKVPPN